MGRRQTKDGELERLKRLLGVGDGRLKRVDRDGKVIIELDLDDRPERGGRRDPPGGRRPLGWDEDTGRVPADRKTVRRMVTMELRHVKMLRRWCREHGLPDNLSAAIRRLIEDATSGDDCG
jgi:hypothetical protein